MQHFNIKDYSKHKTLFQKSTDTFDKHVDTFIALFLLLVAVLIFGGYIHSWISHIPPKLLAFTGLTTILTGGHLVTK